MRSWSWTSVVGPVSSAMLFILGVFLIGASVYLSVTDSVHGTFTVFVTIGLILIVFSVALVLYIRKGEAELVVHGKQYGLNSGSWKKDMVEEIKEIVSEGIETDSNGSVSDSSNPPQIDPLQFTADEINKQIAIKNYLRELSDDQGLEIVEINNNTIRASSETELDLAKGLLFNVFTNTGSTSERVATAELTESESTSGRVYEFEIIEWKYNDDEEIGRARNRIEANQGRMKIITEGIVEVDEAELKTAREQILEMKNKRDMQYET